MTDTGYALVRELPEMDYDTVVARVTELLAGEGFGVLTEIDVKATLKKKLDVDFKRYVILGACNPPMAHQALSMEPDIGVLLPCNVCVSERDGGGARVAAMNPAAAFNLIDNPEISGVADEVRSRLQRVIDAL
ncbi:MAG: DUF302 domain-containing protein [Candidatus Sulfomarinibacteraceae bacterium]